MFEMLKRLFGAAKTTSEAVAKPEVAREVIADAAAKKTPRKRAGRPRKASKQ